ncbi:MAG: HNH endonuclease [Candidatus Woesebacteria bacterium]|nr:HNH endonuclease [Candidatus Woesebacteria bacterium]
MSGNIPIKDIKILCMRSGNRCAFPDCGIVLVQNSTLFDKESIIAEIAHISGEKQGSARYDPTMTDKERNSYHNLILICNNHHQLIDDQPNSQTVANLHQMKLNHENWIIESTRKEIINVTFVELEIVTKYLMSNQTPTTDNYTLIPPKDKIRKNGLSNNCEKLITMGMTQVKQVADFIERSPDIDFGERLKEGFVAKYKKLKNEENLIGDDLFNNLLEFASAGSNDFKQKAAGLAILVYLFEKCEVFEK